MCTASRPKTFRVYNKRKHAYTYTVSPRQYPHQKFENFCTFGPPPPCRRPASIVFTYYMKRKTLAFHRFPHPARRILVFLSHFFWLSHNRESHHLTQASIARCPLYFFLTEAGSRLRPAVVVKLGEQKETSTEKHFQRSPNFDKLSISN